MKTRLLLIGLLSMTAILGGMLYVDVYRCVQDFYPSGLYFAICSETFGFRTITTEIVNSVYHMDQTIETKHNPNECWYQEDGGEMMPCVVDGSVLDLDSDLSPSYALDIMGGAFYLTFLPLVGISVGITGLFLAPYFILKRKNITTRPYMVLILVGVLSHYGITGLITHVPQLPLVLFLISKENDSYLTAQLLIPFCTQVIALGIAVILLYRSSIIRKLVKK